MAPRPAPRGISRIFRPAPSHKLIKPEAKPCTFPSLVNSAAKTRAWGPYWLRMPSSPGWLAWETIMLFTWISGRFPGVTATASRMTTTSF